MGSRVGHWTCALSAFLCPLRSWVWRLIQELPWTEKSRAVCITAVFALSSLVRPAPAAGSASLAAACRCRCQGSSRVVPQLPASRSPYGFARAQSPLLGDRYGRRIAAHVAAIGMSGVVTTNTSPPWSIVCTPAISNRSASPACPTECSSSVQVTGSYWPH